MWLIIVWDAQLGRRLCDCMAHGMKNAAKHVVRLYPDGFEFTRSLLGAGGITSYCLG